MKTQLRKTVSYAERSGWTLDYFDEKSFIVSRLASDSPKRKRVLLTQYAEQNKCEVEIFPCDDLLVMRVY